MHKLKIIRNPVAFTISFLLILVIIVNLAAFFRKSGEMYLKPFDASYYKDLYGKSQYVNATPSAVIPDEFVYSHASWEYIQGTNPAVFNADQPPLGKYFIGLGEKYLNNEKLMGPAFNILSLIALFVLSKIILKSTNWALALVALFSLEKLFMVQMIYAPLLDNIQLFFILVSFIFYILSLKQEKFLIPAFLTLGCVMSVKFWATGVVIYVIWLLHTLFYKNLRKVLDFIIFTPAILISMLIVYMPSFLQGDSIHRFFGVQKYIYKFHEGKLHIDPTAVWDLLLLNRWHVPWDGTITKSVDWQWTWPVITILSLVMIFKIIKNKKYPIASPMGVLVIWFIAYFFLLSIGAVVARYLIPVLPAMFLLSFKVVQDYFIKFSKK